MDTNLTLPNHPPITHQETERRSKSRIREPFPVTVHGVDASGERFKADAVLDNLSANGLYLRLMRRVKPGAALSIFIRLSNSLTNGASAPRIAIHGVVLRAEEQPDGACGMGVAFTHYRFL